MEILVVGAVAVVAVLAAVGGIRLGILVAQRMDRHLAVPDEEERRDRPKRGG